MVAFRDRNNSTIDRMFRQTRSTFGIYYLVTPIQVPFTKVTQTVTMTRDLDGSPDVPSKYFCCTATRSIPLRWRGRIRWLSL